MLVCSVCTMDYKNIALTLFILIGLSNSAHIPEVSELDNEGYKPETFDFGEYKKIKQQDPQQMRYQQQQKSDNLDKNFSLRAGKVTEDHDQSASASQDIGVKVPAPSVWKVVHPKFVTEKLEEKKGKIVKKSLPPDSYQVKEIQDRNDLFSTNVNLVGKTPKVLQQNLGGFVGNHQDAHLQALNSLLGQNPDVQLQGLQQLLNTHGPVYIHNKDHTPIKEDVEDIPNPQSKPNIKVQHDQEDMIKTIQALAQNSVSNDPDSLKSLQAQLDATASAHAEALIAQAQQKALQQVQAQHAAIARAQAEAEKAAFAQVKAQNEILNRRHAENVEVESRRQAEYQSRQQAENENRRQAVNEGRMQAEYHAKQAKFEARRQAEIESRKQAEYQAKQAELEARRQAEIESRRQAEYQAKQGELEARRQAEIESREQAEYQAKQTELEARRQAEIESRRQAEYQAKQAELEARRQAEIESRKQAEYQAKQAELETRRYAEIESRKQAEIEARRQSELEALRLAEKEARRNAELEAIRIAENEARRKAELEAIRIAENEARNKAEREALRIAENEARRNTELAEARRQAELDERRNSEIEARKHAQFEARRQLEQAAHRHSQIQAEQESRRLADFEAQRQSEAENEAIHIIENEARRQLDVLRESETEARRQAQLESKLKYQAGQEAHNRAESEERERQRKQEEYRAKKEREQDKLQAKLSQKNDKAPEASETQHLYYTQTPVQSPTEDVHFVNTPVYTQASIQEVRSPVYAQHQSDQAVVTKYYIPPKITVQEGQDKDSEEEVSRSLTIKERAFNDADVEVSDVKDIIRSKRGIINGNRYVEDETTQSNVRQLHKDNISSDGTGKINDVKFLNKLILNLEYDGIQGNSRNSVVNDNLDYIEGRNHKNLNVINISYLIPNKRESNFKFSIVEDNTANSDYFDTKHDEIYYVKDNNNIKDYILSKRKLSSKFDDVEPKIINRGIHDNQVVFFDSKVKSGISRSLGLEDVKSNVESGNTSKIDQTYDDVKLKTINSKLHGNRDVVDNSIHKYFIEYKNDIMGKKYSPNDFYGGVDVRSKFRRSHGDHGKNLSKFRFDNFDRNIANSDVNKSNNDKVHASNINTILIRSKYAFSIGNDVRNGTIADKRNDVSYSHRRKRYNTYLNLIRNKQTFSTRNDDLDTRGGKHDVFLERRKRDLNEVADKENKKVNFIRNYGENNSSDKDKAMHTNFSDVDFNVAIKFQNNNNTVKRLNQTIGLNDSFGEINNVFVTNLSKQELNKIGYTIYNDVNDNINYSRKFMRNDGENNISHSSDVIGYDKESLDETSKDLSNRYLEVGTIVNSGDEENINRDVKIGVNKSYYISNFDVSNNHTDFNFNKRILKAGDDKTINHDVKFGGLVTHDGDGNFAINTDGTNIRKRKREVVTAVDVGKDKNINNDVKDIGVRNAIGDVGDELNINLDEVIVKKRKCGDVCNNEKVKFISLYDYGTNDHVVGRQNVNFTSINIDVKNKVNNLKKQNDININPGAGNGDRIKITKKSRSNMAAFDGRSSGNNVIVTNNQKNITFTYNTSFDLNTQDDYDNHKNVKLADENFDTDVRDILTEKRYLRPRFYDVEGKWPYRSNYNIVKDIIRSKGKKPSSVNSDVNLNTRNVSNTIRRNLGARVNHEITDLITDEDVESWIDRNLELHDGKDAHLEFFTGMKREETFPVRIGVVDVESSIKGNDDVVFDTFKRRKRENYYLAANKFLRRRELKSEKNIGNNLERRNREFNFTFTDVDDKVISSSGDTLKYNYVNIYEDNDGDVDVSIGRKDTYNVDKNLNYDIDELSRSRQKLKPFFKYKNIEEVNHNLLKKIPDVNVVVVDDQKLIRNTRAMQPNYDRANLFSDIKTLFKWKGEFIDVNKNLVRNSRALAPTYDHSQVGNNFRSFIKRKRDFKDTFASNDIDIARNITSSQKLTTNYHGPDVKALFRRKRDVNLNKVKSFIRRKRELNHAFASDINAENFLRSNHDDAHINRDDNALLKKKRDINSNEVDKDDESITSKFQKLKRVFNDTNLGNDEETLVRKKRDINDVLKNAESLISSTQGYGEVNIGDDNNSYLKRKLDINAEFSDDSVDTGNPISKIRNYVDVIKSLVRRKRDFNTTYAEGDDDFNDESDDSENDEAMDNDDDDGDDNDDDDNISYYIIYAGDDNKSINLGNKNSNNQKNFQNPLEESKSNDWFPSERRMDIEPQIASHLLSPRIHNLSSLVYIKENKTKYLSRSNSSHINDFKPSSDSLHQNLHDSKTVIHAQSKSFSNNEDSSPWSYISGPNFHDSVKTVISREPHFQEGNLAERNSSSDVVTDDLKLNGKIKSDFEHTIKNFRNNETTFKSGQNIADHIWSDIELRLNRTFTTDQSKRKFDGGDQHHIPNEPINLNWQKIDIPSRPFIYGRQMSDDNKSSLKLNQTNEENHKISSRYSQNNRTQDYKAKSLTYNKTNITRYYHSSYSTATASNQSRSNNGYFVLNPDVITSPIPINSQNENAQGGSKVMDGIQNSTKSFQTFRNSDVEVTPNITALHDRQLKNLSESVFNATRVRLNLSDVDHPTSHTEFSKEDQTNRKSRAVEPAEWIIGKYFLPSRRQNPMARIDRHRLSKRPLSLTRSRGRKRKPVQNLGEIFFTSTSPKTPEVQTDTDSYDLGDDYQPSDPSSYGNYYESYEFKPENEKKHGFDQTYHDSYLPERDHEQQTTGNDQIGDYSHKPYSYKTVNHNPDHHYFSIDDHHYITKQHHHKPVVHVYHSNNEKDFESFDFSKLKSYFSKNNGHRLPFSTQPVIQTFHFNDDDDGLQESSSIKVAKVTDKHELEKYHPTAIIIINNGEKKGDEHDKKKEHKHGHGHGHRKHRRPHRVYMRKVPVGKINFVLKKIIRRKH